jgi:hypothetical protein
MSAIVRKNISLQVTPETSAAIDRLARERNTTKTGLVLQSLGLMQTVHEARKRGEFIGTSRDREALDVVLLGIAI